MCGIVGYISKQFRVDEDILKSMRDSLFHRGPDDAGLWISKNKQVGLAHRRLSIIDLSVAGRQPMSDGNEKAWIIYNGEVYNFKVLRQELQDKGYIFRTNTDSEVVLKSYLEWGFDCLERFNGMFAFAVYDSNKGFLFLARDRVGKKPLYYFEDNTLFTFASELKAITKGLNRQFELDREALNYYLAFGYIPGSMCILKGVRKLPPAHAAIYDIQKNTLRTWKYWDIPHPEENNQRYSESELVEELEYLLEDSVRLRMISDVPLGIFLSGGIDSSIITAMAARCSLNPVKTFTISFPGAGKYDESDYARIVSNHFKTNHRILSGNENIINSLREIIPFIDEPIADFSILPTYLVSKLTRKHVIVALGGDGGDELFGGYSHYKQILRDKQIFRYIPKSFLHFIAKIAGQLPPGLKGRNRLSSLKGGYLEENIWSNPYFNLDLRKKLFSKKVLKELGSFLGDPEKWKLTMLSRGHSDVDKLTRLDFLSYLPEDIMTKVDRASMACSLEVRAPWLDYRIIEFAFKKVPPKYKVHHGETRILEKRLAERLLPKELNLNRKQGFSVPIDNWLRGKEGQQWSKILLNFDSTVFNKSFIKTLLNGEKWGWANGSRLWALGMLRYFIENSTKRNHFSK